MTAEELPAGEGDDAEGERDEVPALLGETSEGKPAAPIPPSPDEAAREDALLSAPLPQRKFPAPSLSALARLDLFLKTEATTMINSYYDSLRAAGVSIESPRDPARRSTVAPKRAATAKAISEVTCRTPSRSLASTPREANEPTDFEINEQGEIVFPESELSQDFQGTFWWQMLHERSLWKLIRSEITRLMKQDEREVSALGQPYCGVCVVPAEWVSSWKASRKEKPDIKTDVGSLRQRFRRRQLAAKELRVLIRNLANEAHMKGSTCASLRPMLDDVASLLQQNDLSVSSKHKGNLDLLVRANSVFKVPGYRQVLTKSGTPLAKPLVRAPRGTINVYAPAAPTAPVRMDEANQDSENSGDDGSREGKETGALPQAQALPQPGRFLGVWQPTRRTVRFQLLLRAIDSLVRVSRLKRSLAEQFPPPVQGTPRGSPHDKVQQYRAIDLCSTFMPMTDSRLHSLYTSARVRGAVRRLFDLIADEERGRVEALTFVKYQLDVLSGLVPSFSSKNNVAVAEEDLLHSSEGGRPVMEWENFYRVQFEWAMMFHDRRSFPNEGSFEAFFEVLHHWVTTCDLTHPDHDLAEKRTSNIEPSKVIQRRTKPQRSESIVSELFTTAPSIPPPPPPGQPPRSDVLKGLAAIESLDELLDTLPPQYTNILLAAVEQVNASPEVEVDVRAPKSSSAALFAVEETGEEDELDALLQYLVKEPDTGDTKLTEKRKAFESRRQMQRTRMLAAVGSAVRASQLDDSSRSSSEAGSEIDCDEAEDSVYDEWAATVRRKARDELMQVAKLRARSRPGSAAEQTGYVKRYRPTTALGATSRALRLQASAASRPPPEAPESAAHALQQLARVPGIPRVTIDNYAEYESQVHQHLHFLRERGLYKEALALKRAYGVLKSLPRSYMDALGRLEENIKSREGAHTEARARRERLVKKRLATHSPGTRFIFTNFLESDLGLTAIDPSEEGQPSPPSSASPPSTPRIPREEIDDGENPQYGPADPEKDCLPSRLGVRRRKAEDVIAASRSNIVKLGKRHPRRNVLRQLLVTPLHIPTSPRALTRDDGRLEQAVISHSHQIMEPIQATPAGRTLMALIKGKVVGLTPSEQQSLKSFTGVGTSLSDQDEAEGDDMIEEPAGDEEAPPPDPACCAALLNISAVVVWVAIASRAFTSHSAAAAAKAAGCCIICVTCAMKPVVTGEGHQEGRKHVSVTDLEFRKTVVPAPPHPPTPSRRLRVGVEKKPRPPAPQDDPFVHVLIGQQSPQLSAATPPSPPPSLPSPKLPPPPMEPLVPLSPLSVIGKQCSTPPEAPLPPHPKPSRPETKKRSAGRAAPKREVAHPSPPADIVRDSAPPVPLTPVHPPHPTVPGQKGVTYV